MMFRLWFVCVDSLVECVSLAKCIVHNLVKYVSSDFKISVLGHNNEERGVH